MTDVNSLSELEYKVLTYLREDSRTSSSKLARELGVSRATIAKILQSLREKGIKFTVEFYEEGKLTVFAVASACAEGAECYRLIDGKFMVTITGSMEQVEEVLSKLKTERYFIAVQKVGSTRVRRSSLRCDYCGGEIAGEPLVVRRGKKVYYTCCRTCQTQLAKKLRTGKGEGSHDPDGPGPDFGVSR
ncbi:TRASH domain-containing protein [Metallosphaera javensis (ex Sakai et al. 2022)]|uniref:TRASH domain-containing protein n=1 Tax=Metallosphaera javensis (ex Sakai et al. 2022) TaxID=2775498 RepID=UPI002584D4E6|nr:MAG: bifunctional ligase/repressor BirA [Metallosphaera javensis (ex Sakai et al. 2022)]